ncbi:hypothetical protein NIES4071_107840 (plasmid) [Calothrix sp. NIES-4071]|nr:hypothetical protein NIES4071_107840 [Calothrix sp. NIES-4071]BAZ64824.1 hypothetical protein NIES4105_105570 [Calothrix sp. NIES-4105]
MPWLYIPHKKPEEIKEDDELWYIGFDKIYFVVEEDCIYFEYQSDSKANVISSRNKDNFAVRVAPNGKVKGKGSVTHKSTIEYIYSWYKIATGEIQANLPSKFIGSLIYDSE